MRYWGITIGVLLLLMATGCASSGNSVVRKDISLIPLHSSDLDGVGVELHRDYLEVSLVTIPAAGIFAHGRLPVGQSISTETWVNDEYLLHIVVPQPDGYDIGIVPLAEYDGKPVQLNLAFSGQIRSVSTPPTNPDAGVTDLAVTPGDPGMYNLEWTERNPGDYNADGVVSVNDLTPLGIHYGKKTEDGVPVWVDGNGDGLISQADITTIGQNYDASISGYIVKRNGETVVGPDGINRTGRNGTPPVYSTVLPGEFNDFWQVLPVDSEYPASNPGVASAAALVGELLVAASITGPGFSDISDLKQSNFNNGMQILRIIDPIDIVNNISIGERLMISEYGHVVQLSDGSALIGMLPRNIPLVLEIIYAPVVNLRNGEPWGSSLNGIDTSQLVISAIPLTLSPVEPFTSIEIEVSLSQTPLGGYYVETQTGRITGELDIEQHTRVDFAAGRVSMLTATDHTFDDEAMMSDTDRDGISNSRLRQELDATVFGDVFTTGEKYRGTVQSGFIEATGKLVLHDAYRIIGVSEHFQGNLQFHFSEQTQFGVLDVDTSVADPGEIDPSTLRGGDEVLIIAYSYKSGYGDDEIIVFWAELIAKYVN